MSPDQCDAVEAFALKLIRVNKRIETELFHPLFQKFARRASTSNDASNDPAGRWESKVVLILEKLIRFAEPTVQKWQRFDVDKKSNIFHDLDQWFGRLTEGISQVFRSLDPIADDLVAFHAAPPKTGYEQRLMSLLGYTPIRAKIATYYISKLGIQFARDYNQARKRLGALMPQLAKASDGNTLAISRRARQLIELLNEAEVAGLIQPIVEIHLSLTIHQFVEIVELAANRDQFACRRLRTIAKDLLLFLPSSRGAPLSERTATHMFFLRELEVSGYRVGYSWSSSAEEYVDPMTKATQEEFMDPDFDPRYAWQLLKKKKASDQLLKQVRDRRQQLAANAGLPC